MNNLEVKLEEKEKWQQPRSFMSSIDGGDGKKT